MEVEAARVRAFGLGHGPVVFPAGGVDVVPPQAAVARATMASKPIKAFGPNQRIADRRSSITPPQSESTHASSRRYLLICPKPLLRPIENSISTGYLPTKPPLR